MPTKNSHTPNNGLPSTLAKPAQRALASAGITRLEQLHKLSEDDLNSMHGIGPSAIRALRVALKAQGLTFAKMPRG